MNAVEPRKIDKEIAINKNNINPINKTKAYNEYMNFYKDNFLKVDDEYVNLKDYLKNPTVQISILNLK